MIPPSTKAAAQLVVAQRLGQLVILAEGAFSRLPRPVRTTIGRLVRSLPGFRNYGRAASRFLGSSK